MTDHPQRTPAMAADGFEVIRGFFSPEMTADLARRGAAVVEGVENGTLQRSSQFTSGLDYDWYEPLIYNPNLVAHLQSMLGQDLSIVTWRIVMKDAGHFSGPINIHQDWPYFGGGPDKLNVFIPLSTVNRANGAMIFYRGSHHYGPLTRGDIDVQRYPECEPVCPELEVGDLLIADFLTWHASGPAEENAAPRIMIQMVFQPAIDPSSKHIVAGEIRNPAFCQVPLDAMREPLTQVTVRTARDYLEQGNLERAEAFARGAYNSDPAHGAAAALVMYDLLTAKGSAEADDWLGLARKSLDGLNAAMQARGPAPIEGERPQEPVPRPRVASLLRALVRER
jgi:hypothetical protein